MWDCLPYKSVHERKSQSWVHFPEFSVVYKIWLLRTTTPRHSHSLITHSWIQSPSQHLLTVIRSLNTHTHTHLWSIQYYVCLLVAVIIKPVINCCFPIFPVLVHTVCSSPVPCQFLHVFGLRFCLVCLDSKDHHVPALQLCITLTFSTET